MITTRQITRGALMIALYGLLILLNQQLSLAIEGYMPWLFALPIFIYSVREPLKASLCVLASMFLITLIFSGVTTWLFGTVYLLAGFLYGKGVSLGLSRSTIMVIVFAMLCLSGWLSTVVFASLFGYDLNEELASIEKMVPWLNPRILISLVVLVSAALETLVVHLASQVLSLRLHLDVPEPKTIWDLQPRPWTDLVLVVLLILTGIALSMVQCPVFLQTLLVLAASLMLMFMDYRGCAAVLRWLQSHGRGKLVFLAVLGAFVPPVCLIWAVIGFWDNLRGLFQPRRKN